MHSNILFERFLENGDIAKDQFENPGDEFAREFAYGKTEL